MAEISFHSERAPKYFRKQATYRSLKPRKGDFDRRMKLKQIYEDNTPYT